MTTEELKRTLKVGSRVRRKGFPNLVNEVADINKDGIILHSLYEGKVAHKSFIDWDWIHRYEIELI